MHLLVVLHLVLVTFKDVGLVLLKIGNLLAQLVIFFLQCFDTIVHVSLALVRNERLLETVGN